jgi:MFS family permease
MAIGYADAIQEPVTLRKMLPIITASTVGTAIEWYDFFLYGFLAATVFPQLFFPTLDPYTGIIAAFTTNFVGFVARPIGGAFFGWFGDRVGRKSTLVATLLLMGIATILMGTLSGYATIGIAAPLILALLRFLQGIGLGGEWAGSVLLSMEYGDDRRRGFWASWPQTGVPIGLALAATAVLLFKQLYPGDAFSSVGWRIPFFLSSTLVSVGLYIRLRILETPAFSRVKEKQCVTKAPLVEVLRYHWREVMLCILLRSADNGPFYLFTTFVLSYGVEVEKLDLNLLYLGLVCSALTGLVIVPLSAIISDHIGRKLWFMLGAVLMAIFALPYFLLLQTRLPVLVVVALIFSIGICICWLYGPEAALIAERFPTRLRYSGTSLGYQLASITAGGPAPIIATYLLVNHHALTGGFASGAPPYLLIACYIVLTAVVSFVATLPLKEYTGKAAAE